MKFFHRSQYGYTTNLTSVDTPHQMVRRLSGGPRLQYSTVRRQNDEIQDNSCLENCAVPSGGASACPQIKSTLSDVNGVCYQGNSIVRLQLVVNLGHLEVLGDSSPKENMRLLE